jgi:hypothetical protein
VNTIVTGLQAISVVLQLLLLYLLLRGPFRRYFVLFVFSLAQLITTALEQWVFYTVGTSGSLYRNVFWTDEVVIDLLMFLLVITLTYQALENSPMRAAAGKLLFAVVMLALILPFVIYYRYPIFSTRWFNGTSQILNFGAAVMNLALWTALIGSKRRDRQLLTVSVGLGLAVAGQAVGFGLRQFTTNHVGRDAAYLFLLLIHLTGIGVWCWAFWKERPALETGTHVPA